MMKLPTFFLALLLATSSSATAECMDTLADTPSPIKSCDVLIQSYPCGSVVSCCGIEVDAVCAKTCGTCGSDGDSDNNVGSDTYGGGAGGDNASPFSLIPPELAAGFIEAEVFQGEGFVVADVIPPFSPSEYTTLNVTTDAVYVTSRAPVNSAWFGYQFYNFDFSRDMDAGGMYMFRPQINEVTGEATVVATSFWSTYLGPPIESLNHLGTFFECPPEVEQEYNGTVCIKGDFMIQNSFLMTGCREQPAGRRDVEILDAHVNGDYIVVHWRRSRRIPFDRDVVSLRYASAPSDYETDNWQFGYQYHGPTRFHSQPISLLTTDDANASDEEVDADFPFSISGGLGLSPSVLLQGLSLLVAPMVLIMALA